MKATTDHMSRGLALARSHEVALAAAAALLERSRRPVLVEELVAGRELAVSVVARGGAPEVLPILEWRLAEGEEGVLTSEHKLRAFPCRAEDARPADLPPAARAAVEAAALRAWAALGLRDYARFDVRLARDGTPFFLEANTKPSLERCEALSLSAGYSGFDYPGLIARLLAAAAERGAKA